MEQNWGELPANILLQKLQKYTSLWIDPSDVLVFTAYLGMDQIFTDYPTGSKQMACIFFAIFDLFLYFLLGDL